MRYNFKQWRKKKKIEKLANAKSERKNNRKTKKKEFMAEDIKQDVFQRNAFVVLFETHGNILKKEKANSKSSQTR